jgi:hypothetical protein
MPFKRTRLASAAPDMGSAMLIFNLHKTPQIAKSRGFYAHKKKLLVNVTCNHNVFKIGRRRIALAVISMTPGVFSVLQPMATIAKPLHD